LAPLDARPGFGTPGRAHRRLKHHWRTQARHNSPPDWCALSGIHVSRFTLTLRCCHTACMKTLPGMSIPPQHSIPKSPPLLPPSRTKLGIGSAMHLRTIQQLFSAHAGRQSLSGVLSPGWTSRGAPHVARGPRRRSLRAAPPRHWRCQYRRKKLLSGTSTPLPGVAPALQDKLKPVGREPPRPSHAARDGHRPWHHGTTHGA
jgi:hypothetical protein